MDFNTLGSATNIAILVGVLLFGLLVIGVVLARLYTRASKEISYVRTGMGGQKVIKNGGSIVFPVLHEIIPVNMNTLRLAVHRANEQALITRDRMRVDVVAEFYVRVQPTDDAIANAAQTLGSRTMQPEKLKDLVEGKFVDALRSVAAEMTMEDLHEQRVDFVQKVQQVVSEDLLKNGLELETVSLTGLDQTGMEYFNPNNAFDAEGLTRLTEEIEQRKKIRNDIEQDTAVQIKNKNLQAAKETLEIDREEEYARLAQEREVEIRRAAQVAEIAKEQADKEREAEQAKIIASQQVQTSSITSERAVEEERIEKDKLIKERDIAKDRAVETQDIERRKAVDLAEQERDIAISVKSKEQSEAAAEADQARALAVQAEEKVSTARETEIADRQKQIELIEAAKEAEREAIAVKIAAEAEKLAAADTAEAIREKARGEADEARITAEAEAEAEKMRAAASEIRYAVEATGNKALNEAANLLSNEQVGMRVKLELIENLEAIIRESAKPMENIDDIKIIQLDGLNGATAASGEVSGVAAGGDNLADRVVSSALKYRAQAPLVDSLLSEVGLKADDFNGFTEMFTAKGTDAQE
jgi:uncharacterized membrane protein YqiK